MKKTGNTNVMRLYAGGIQRIKILADKIPQKLGQISRLYVDNNLKAVRNFIVRIGELIQLQQ